MLITFTPVSMSSATYYKRHLICTIIAAFKLRHPSHALLGSYSSVMVRYAINNEWYGPTQTGERLSIIIRDKPLLAEMFSMCVGS